MLLVDESGSMTADVRVFKAVSDTELTELSDTGFDDEKSIQESSDTGFDEEKSIQELVQHNLEKMFGLKFLATEFRVRINDVEHWLDTVAFDEEENTFVVIEYKNTLGKGVLNQTRTYLNCIKYRKDAFILKYIEKTEDYRNTKEFEWDEAYAIIVAPKFSERQIVSAKHDRYLELHRIKRYDDDIIVTRRAGGAHERVPASASTKAGNGRPESVRDVDDAEKDYLGEKGASDATRTVWRKLKERVQSELAGTRFDMPWYGGGFYLPNGRVVCVITVKSDKVELSWNVKKDQEQQTDDFVKYHKTWKDGTKNYRACVDTAAHIENAARVVHTVYDLKSK